MTCVNRITLHIYRFLPAVLQVNTWKAIFSQFLGNLYQNYMLTSTYIVAITKLLQTQNDFTRPLSAGGCTTTVTLGNSPFPGVREFFFFSRISIGTLQPD